MNTEELISELISRLYWGEEPLEGLRNCRTFQEACLLTRDDGIVLRFDDDSEFQLTVIQSKWPK